MFKKMIQACVLLATASCGVQPSFAGSDGYCAAVVSHLTSLPMEDMIQEGDSLVRVANTSWTYECRVSGNFVLIKGDFEKGFYRAFQVWEDETHYYVRPEAML